MSQRQINIRLPDEDAAVLEAGAFLDAGSLAEFVRQTLLDRVETLRSNPRVLEVLRLRAEEAAEKEGVLRPMRGGKKRDKAGDGQST